MIRKKLAAGILLLSISATVFAGCDSATSANPTATVILGGNPSTAGTPQSGDAAPAPVGTQQGSDSSKAPIGVPTGSAALSSPGTEMPLATSSVPTSTLQPK